MKRSAAIAHLVLAIVRLGIAGAHAGDIDQEVARDALRKGLVRPLADILREVKPRLDGEIVEIEFESRNGKYVYEFEVISSGGQLREIDVDALTAEILAVRDEKADEDD